MGEGSTLHLRNRGKPSGFNLNGKPCLTERLEQCGMSCSKGAAGEHHPSRRIHADRSYNALLFPLRTATPGILRVTPLAAQRTAAETDKGRRVAITGPSPWME